MLRASVAVLLLSAPIAAQRDEGVREGDHFRVVPHFPAGASLAQEALEAAEASWTHALAAYGLGDDARRSGMRVHLYRSRDEFDAACFRCEGRTWPNHSGLTSGRWGIALVLVGRDLDDVTVGALGLTDHDRELIAHEATHLIGHHLAPSYEAYPSWLSEGLAEYVAQATFAPERDPLQRPSISSRVAWVQDLHAREALPTGEELVADAPLGLDPYVLYALYGAFVGHLMREHEGALRHLMAGLDDRSGNEEVRRLLLERLPAEGLAALDRGFRAELSSAAPPWAIGEGSLEPDGERLLIVARETRGAAAWHSREIGGGMGFAGEIRRGRGALELRFGRNVRHAGEAWEETYLAVVFDEDRVSVERCVRRGGTGPVETEHRSLAGAAARMPVDRDVPVAVRVAEGRVGVEVAGERALVVEVEVPSGQWGIGSRPKAWGWWRGLVAEDG